MQEKSTIHDLHQFAIMCNKKTHFVQTAWKAFSFFINRQHCTLGLQSFRRHFHWSERKIRLTEAADSGA